MLYNNVKPISSVWLAKFMIAQGVPVLDVDYVERRVLFYMPRDQVSAHWSAWQEHCKAFRLERGYEYTNEQQRLYESRHSVKKE